MNPTTIELRLQFFAKDGPGGEKTEQPTSKKLNDARKEGQVAKSKEVENALSLIAMFLALRFGVGYVYRSFLGVFGRIYNKMPELVTHYGGNFPYASVFALLRVALLGMLLTILPFLLLAFVVSFFADYIQVKWKVTSKPLKPKFSKLNPIKGMKKIISPNSLMELLKSLLKIALITYVAYLTIKNEYNLLYQVIQVPLMQGIIMSGTVALNLGLRCAMVYLLIALLDFVYQKRKFTKEQMMTKQEVKEEFKQAEGDPQIRGKIRQKMREVSQRRMMQSIPDADVVITNPTHFAVAVAYDANKAEAPLVLAKGADVLAFKIKESAKEHRIKIVENKPLARMLYYNTEVGEVIPPELYQAVAEVLAMVYHAQGKI